MSVSLIGYSERGMINALCSDILYPADKSIDRLKEFLGWCSFPTEFQPDIAKIVKAELVVEQSFSDFGTPDLIILLEYSDAKKQLIMVEAKVSAGDGNQNRINNQWVNSDAYFKGTGNKSSSLFVQIYRGNRLIKKIITGEGEFRHGRMGPQKWSLGQTKIVIKAVDKLRDYCTGNALPPMFLAIIPDTAVKIRAVLDLIDKVTYASDELPDWSLHNLGYISWRKIDELIKIDSSPGIWSQLRVSFEWNESNQIYWEVENVVSPDTLPKHGWYVYDNKQVYIAFPSNEKCRVVPFDKEATNFPESHLVNSGLLINLEPINDPVEVEELKPKKDSIYCWNRPARDYREPSDTLPMPEEFDSCQVKVLSSGWIFSVVIIINKSGDPHTHYKVFNHHLEKN